MIVYRRKIEKNDIDTLEEKEELIYYRDNNIAYLINRLDNGYIMRKKKIFNNQLIDERRLKTSTQLIKVID